MKKNPKKSLIFRKDAGFTLVEIMVSMTIFVIVMTLAVGGFISLVRLQSQAESITDVQQNGRIAIEQITRLARQAEGVEILAGDQGLKLTVGAQATCFKVSDMALVKTENCEDDKKFTLSSSDVKITDFSFTKQEGFPPILNIFIEVVSQGTDENKINLNTSVVLTAIK